MSTAYAHEADFFQLGFASQMIVWAARKRLHLLSRGTSEACVIEVFGIAGFDALHASLMHVLDVLLCGASNRIQLHAVACPCLSPHEVSLLNALAFLQRQQTAESQRRLRALLGDAAMRLAQPALCAIVNELDERGLELTLIQETPPVRVRHGVLH
jgi:hypothetical protein